MGLPPAQLAASPTWVLIHSWPAVIDRAIVIDIAVALLMYIPVGIFGLLELRQNFRAATAVTMTLIFALALCSSIEMTDSSFRVKIPER